MIKNRQFYEKSEKNDKKSKNFQKNKKGGR